MSTREYDAYGLRVRSALPLPFAPAAGPRAIDIDIELGPIEPDSQQRLAVRNWRARPGSFILDVAGTARILVSEGKRIRIELLEGRNSEDVMSHVLGSAFAALLQQRGQLPIHACCIETSIGAVLATGTSGGWKVDTALRDAATRF